MNKNKGFSLVELIVVVAIMAVLVGILAPAYLSYVEKTRRGTDEDMAEEVRHTIEVALADICVYDNVADGSTFAFTAPTASIYNPTAGGTASSTPQQLQCALQDVYGAKVFKTKSKKYATATYTVTVSHEPTSTAAITVEGVWSGTH